MGFQFCTTRVQKEVKSVGFQFCSTRGQKEVKSVGFYFCSTRVQKEVKSVGFYYCSKDLTLMRNRVQSCILASLVDNSVRPPSQIIGEDAPA